MKNVGGVSFYGGGGRFLEGGLFRGGAFKREYGMPKNCYHVIRPNLISWNTRYATLPRCHKVPPLKINITRGFLAALRYKYKIPP